MLFRDKLSHGCYAKSDLAGEIIIINLEMALP